jgi:hypothetical protein
MTFTIASHAPTGVSGADPKPAGLQTSDRLPDANRTGANPHIDVSPSQGQGLWAISEQIHRELSDEMKARNPVHEIYAKLERNAIDEHGFARGSADGALPARYQGARKSGRDLDLVYASDRFQIDLEAPKEAPAAKADAKPGTREHLVNSDGFKSLSESNQAKAIALGEARGWDNAHAIVNNKGFQSLKGFKVQEKDGSNADDAQGFVLDKARNDDAFRAALQSATSGQGGFKGLGDDPVKEGRAIVYMALYTGRGKGYGEQDGGKDGKVEALRNLWNGVLATDPFQHEKTTENTRLWAVRLFVQDYGYNQSQYDIGKHLTPDGRLITVDGPLDDERRPQRAS